jgi:hypothetical protein
VGWCQVNFIRGYVGARGGGAFLCGEGSVLVSRVLPTHSEWDKASSPGVMFGSQVGPLSPI